MIKVLQISAQRPLASRVTGFRFAALHLRQHLQHHQPGQEDHVGPQHRRQDRKSDGRLQIERDVQTRLSVSLRRQVLRLAVAQRQQRGEAPHRRQQNRKLQVSGTRTRKSRQAPRLGPQVRENLGLRSRRVCVSPRRRNRKPDRKNPDQEVRDAQPRQDRSLRPLPQHLQPQHAERPSKLGQLPRPELEELQVVAVAECRLQREVADKNGRTEPVGGSWHGESFIAMFSIIRLAALNNPMTTFQP